MPRYSRREVVVYEALFSPKRRPYVIVGQQPSPEFPDQFLALGITTQEAPHRIPVTESDWEIGSLTRESYIDPYYATLLEGTVVTNSVGAIAEDIVDSAAIELARIIGVDESD